MAQQYIFDFAEEIYPDFEQLPSQTNKELMATLHQRAEPFVYLWGSTGSGKTYLLKSWVAQARKNGYRAIYIDALVQALPENIHDYEYIAIDGVANLSTEDQISLFSVFNQFKDQKAGFLLVAANTPPWQLNIREDLRTRMGFCLVYEMHPLTDEEKIIVLGEIARSRQLSISDDVFSYLINHWQRDMDRLVDLLSILDQYSLAVKKPITVPLVKKVLAQENNE